MNQAAGPNFSSDSRQYKEIITKAVCGNIKKFFQVNKEIRPPEGQQASQVLGYTVTEFQFAGKTSLRETIVNQETGINISGTFEIHIWYAYNSGKCTNVIKQTLPFKEIIPITDIASDVIKPVDATVEIIKSPECQEATITDDNKIKVNLELGVLVEIIGETRIWVRITRP